MFSRMYFPKWLALLACCAIATSTQANSLAKSAVCQDSDASKSLVVSVVAPDGTPVKNVTVKVRFGEEENTYQN